MANVLFDKGRQAFAAGDLDWDANNIKLILVDEGTDTPNTATDDFLDDIAAGARVATSGNFAGKTNVDGVCDADDVTLTSVSGATVESIVFYNDSPATEAGKHLIGYINVATGLPLTPNGGNVTVQWQNTSPKIFKL